MLKHMRKEPPPKPTGIKSAHDLAAWQEIAKRVKEWHASTRGKAAA